MKCAPIKFFNTGLWFFGCVLFLSGCIKDGLDKPSTEQTGNLNIGVTHEVDGAILVYDSLIYRNAAGAKYDVSTLFYYISSIRLIDKNNTSYPVGGIYFIDASTGNIILHLNKIPVGQYKSIAFCIGLDTKNNVTGGLPNTIDNLNMAWPDTMGGGYHFLRLEGHYLDSSNTKKGFTMHLGSNPVLVTHNDIPISLTVQEDQFYTLNLVMNINEWFTNPYNYDLSKDGNYIMGIPELMQLISNNGKDVFKLR